MRGMVKRRPILWLASATAVGLLIGIGIGGSEQSRVQDSTVEAELAAAQQARADAESSLNQIEDEVRDLRRRLNRQGSGDHGQGRRKQQPALDEREDGYTAGQFSFTDVQVRDDGLGDFEVRVRATNNGSAVDLADMQATLFHRDSVVADLQAVESFESGQTRTVTFITTDDYSDWDDIEFTVDTL